MVMPLGELIEWVKSDDNQQRGEMVLLIHARQAITEKDHTLVERERLDSEWRNLMLEETALAEHSRVQDLAKKDLEMKRPDGDKEVVITLK